MSRKKTIKDKYLKEAGLNSSQLTLAKGLTFGDVDGKLQVSYKHPFGYLHISNCLKEVTMRETTHQDMRKLWPELVDIAKIIHNYRGSNSHCNRSNSLLKLYE